MKEVHQVRTNILIALPNLINPLPFHHRLGSCHLPYPTLIMNLMPQRRCNPCHVNDHLDYNTTTTPALATRRLCHVDEPRSLDGQVVNRHVIDEPRHCVVPQPHHRPP